MENLPGSDALLPRFVDVMVPPVPPYVYSDGDGIASASNPHLEKYHYPANFAAPSNLTPALPVNVDDDVLVIDAIRYPNLKCCDERADFRGRRSENRRLEKNKLCHYWTSRNSCKYGTLCWYGHGEEELHPSPAFTEITTREKSRIRRSYSSNLVQEQSSSEFASALAQSLNVLEIEQVPRSYISSSENAGTSSVPISYSGDGVEVSSPLRKTGMKSATTEQVDEATDKMQQPPRNSVSMVETAQTSSVPKDRETDAALAPDKLARISISHGKKPETSSEEKSDVIPLKEKTIPLHESTTKKMARGISISIRKKPLYVVKPDWNPLDDGIDVPGKTREEVNEHINKVLYESKHSSSRFLPFF